MTNNVKEKEKRIFDRWDTYLREIFADSVNLPMYENTLLKYANVCQGNLSIFILCLINTLVKFFLILDKNTSFLLGLSLYLDFLFQCNISISLAI